MLQPSLLDLITAAQQTAEQHRLLTQHRRLQQELPRELKDWELFFQRMGGRNTFYCIYFAPNLADSIITERHLTSRRAIDEAYAYAIIYELLPVATLELVHPGRWIPDCYRKLLIAHERRTGRVQIPSRLPPDEPLPR